MEFKCLILLKNIMQIQILSLPAEVTNATNAETDWQDQVLRAALQQNHTLSFSGGNDKTQYYVSGNYLDQPGIIKGY